MNSYFTEIFLEVILVVTHFLSLFSFLFFTYKYLQDNFIIIFLSFTSES